MAVMEPAQTHLVAKLTPLVNQLSALRKQQVRSLEPVVQDLLHRQSRDAVEIERTLDTLLDCACMPEGLRLFKSLCRYYYPINPQAAASYILAYREMWKSESSDVLDSTF